MEQNWVWLENTSNHPQQGPGRPSFVHVRDSQVMEILVRTMIVVTNRIAFWQQTGHVSSKRLIRRNHIPDWLVLTNPAKSPNVNLGLSTISQAQLGGGLLILRPTSTLIRDRNSPGGASLRCGTAHSPTDPGVFRRRFDARFAAREPPHRLVSFGWELP